MPLIRLIARLIDVCCHCRCQSVVAASVVLAGSAAVAQNPVVGAAEQTMATYRLPGVAVSVFTSRGIQTTVFMGVRELGQANAAAVAERQSLGFRTSTANRQLPAAIPTPVG